MQRHRRFARLPTLRYGIEVNASLLTRCPRRLVARRILCSAASILILVASHAHADTVPPGHVVTDGEPDNAFDAAFRFDYEFFSSKTQLQRESLTGAATDAVGLTSDLIGRHSRQQLTPQLDIGIYHDFWLSFALPIVLQERRDLALDGIARQESSAIRDGLLPADGFDAGSSSSTSGDTLWKGISRSGLSQLQIGMGVAPMNQRKDDTKPTWKLGLDVFLPVGKVASFSRSSPSSQTGVGSGVYELSLWTSVAKRIGSVEPFVAMSWRASLAATKTSAFADPGSSTTNALPPQVAGVRFGGAAYVIERPADHLSVTVDVEARAVSHFQGREYTDLWEALSYAGDAATVGAPLVLDQSPTVSGVQGLNYPGVSNQENYLELGGRFSVHAQLGKLAGLGIVADIFKHTPHAVTFADAGKDLPTCGTGKLPCEDDSNEVVNPGTNEVNPLSAPIIDLVGHRFIASKQMGFAISVQAAVQF
jgi:hypothetical protein